MVTQGDFTEMLERARTWNLGISHTAVWGGTIQAGTWQAQDPAAGPCLVCLRNGGVWWGCSKGNKGTDEELRKELGINCERTCRPPKGFWLLFWRRWKVIGEFWAKTWSDDTLKESCPHSVGNKLRGGAMERGNQLQSSGGMREALS